LPPAEFALPKPAENGEGKKIDAPVSLEVIKEKAKKEFEAYDHSKTGFIHIDDASSALIGKFFIRNWCFLASILMPVLLALFWRFIIFIYCHLFRYDANALNRAIRRHFQKPETIKR